MVKIYRHALSLQWKELLTFSEGTNKILTLPIMPNDITLYSNRRSDAINM